MQPCARVRPSAFLISEALPHVSNRYIQLPPSRPESSVPSVRMSPRTLSWRRRREQSVASPSSAAAGYHFDPQYQPLHRSVSDLSPVSPLAERNSFVDGYGRRVSRAEYVRRQQDDTAFVSPRQEYTPYRPEYQPETAPRSAPSVITSFPEDMAGPAVPYMQTTTSWPLASTQPQTYAQNPPYTGFSPVSQNPYDDWGYNSPARQHPSQQAFVTSPTSYSGSGQMHSSGRPRVWARLSRPISTTNSSFPPIHSPIYSPTLRRESEAADEFTSPTDFALFAEATSSLDISPVPSPHATTGGWSRPPPGNYGLVAPYARQTSVSPARLAAPLPPTPHFRSSSSPAQMMRRQPSRGQMLAEAMTGLDLEETRVESDDDELPNYEQSQAEVAAHKRREAARRAQELDEAWSRSRRSGGA